MTDWLAICRAAAADASRAFADLPPGAARERVVGRGMGGDDTTAIDAVVEQAVVARLDEAGVDFALLSEELGRRGAGGALVVLDPIDGSINAKRGLPFSSLSVAVAEGTTMDDVVFAYVYDFGTGDEWTAERGGGARLNGAPLSGDPPKGTIEILALEATHTDVVARHAPRLVDVAQRLRIFGSLAISLCLLADGRVDAVCSLREARAVDIAAGQLLVRERGLAIDLPDDPPFGAAPLDLQGRSRVVAAGTEELCATLSAALSA